MSQEEFQELPCLVDWPPFLMVVQHGAEAWVGVGPTDEQRVPYTAWKYLRDTGETDGWRPQQHENGYQTSVYVREAPPLEPADCGARWWRLNDPSRLDKIIPKVQRLVASDGREFLYVQDGAFIVGKPPTAGAPGRSVRAILGSQNLLLFSATEPGAAEFQAATYSERFGEILCCEDRDLNRLPEILLPDGDAPPIVLQPPCAHVEARGWLCTIQFATPSQNDVSAAALSYISARAPRTDHDAPRRGGKPRKARAVVSGGRAQFPATEWPQWAAWLNEFGVSWTADGDPNAPWRHAVDEARLATLPGWSVPAPNGRLLHPFQKDGVRFAVSRAVRALLGDDMGLGKTVQGMCAAIYQDARRVIVVSPASVRGVWRDELVGWGAANAGQIQMLRDGHDRPSEDTAWLICSYDQITVRATAWTLNSEAEQTAVRAALKACGCANKVTTKDTVKVPVSKADAPPAKATPAAKLIIMIPDEVLTDKVVAAIRETLAESRRPTWDRYIDRRRGALLEALSAWAPDLVIFDEGHRLKNSDAKRTDSAIRLSGSAGGCLILTGTPIQNRTNEPAVLLHVLDPAAYSEVKNSTRITIERIKGLLEPAMIRRLKRDVLTELPPLTEQVVLLAGDGLESVGDREEDIINEVTGQTILAKLRDLGNEALDDKERRGASPVKRTEHNVLRAAWSLGPHRKDKDRDRESEDEDGLPPLSLFEMGRAHMGLAKARASQTLDYVEDILENRGHLVVFAAHHAASDYVEKHLKTKTHWKTAILDGRTPAVRRSDIVRQFQDHKDGKSAIDCLIVGIKAGGEGITLHRADTCLFLEMADNPSTMKQARDRLHRIGQASPVQAIYLIANNPIDQFFRALCLEKAELQGQVLDERVDVLVETRGEDRKPSVINKSATNAESIVEVAPTLPKPIREIAGNGTSPATKEVASKSSPPKTGKLRAVVAPDNRDSVTNQPATNHQSDGGTNSTIAQDGDSVTNSGKRTRRATAWEAAHPDMVRKQTALRVRRHRQKDPDKYREYMRRYMKKKRAAKNTSTP